MVCSGRRAGKPVAMQNNMAPIPGHTWAPTAPRCIAPSVVRPSGSVDRICDDLVYKMPVNLSLAPQGDRVLFPSDGAAMIGSGLGKTRPEPVPAGPKDDLSPTVDIPILGTGRADTRLREKGFKAMNGPWRFGSESHHSQYSKGTSIVPATFMQCRTTRGARLCSGSNWPSRTCNRKGPAAWFVLVRPVGVAIKLRKARVWRFVTPTTTGGACVFRECRAGGPTTAVPPWWPRGWGGCGAPCGSIDLLVGVIQLHVICAQGALDLFKVVMQDTSGFP